MNNDDISVKAVELLFTKQRRTFLNLAMSMVHDAEIAEDILHDSFISLWEKRESVDDFITRVRPTSKSAWSDIEPAIMGDPELYFYFELGSILGGKGQIKKEKKYIGKGYKNRNNIHWLDLAEAGIDTELFRWSLVDNGTNIRYEWWEDDGGALIDHTTSVSIEIPNALGELISPEPVEVNVKIGKKDDYAGSVYAYYIDENNHIYNTSYVMFEIEYRKQ